MESQSSPAPITEVTQPWLSANLSERAPYLLTFVAGADGIGRDQAHAPVDGVGHQAVAVEEPLLVGPQGEVVERRDAVPAHDVAGPELGGAARGQPAVDHRPRDRKRARATSVSPMASRGGQEAVGPVGERHRLDPDQPFGHGPPGCPPRDVGRGSGRYG